MAQSSKFTNSGTIRSIGGTALLVGVDGTNESTGRIEGVIGFTGMLVNYGMITGTTTGLLGSVDNRAGGIITGGVTAIGPTPTTTGFNLVSGSIIQNAGIINGLVNLRSTGYTFTENRYFALPGGVLNGDLLLGNGNMLVVELAGSDNGHFAGINGTVTADNAMLRYRVRSDANASLSPVAGFTAIGYELFDNARLSLTASGVSNVPIQLAGTGSVALDADLALTDQIALGSGGLITPSGYGDTPTRVDIIYQGTMTLRHTDNNRQAAALFIGRSFTNNGTITFADTTTSPFIQNYVFNSVSSLVNNGVVGISGNAGLVNSATSFLNNGAITQTGNAFRPAIQNVANVTNNGSINVAGTGILFSSSGSLLTNSGTLASTGGVAVQNQIGNSSINNLAGGTISGAPGFAAITGFGLNVRNSGTINGDVDLSNDFLNSSYIAAGGVLNGNLRFGRGNDILVVRDGISGISGTIDGGAGQDSYIRSYSTSTNAVIGATMPTVFELEGIETIGDAIVTVTALR